MTQQDFEKLLDKMAENYRPLSKTISDLGADVKKNNDTIIELKTMLRDFIQSTTVRLSSHESSIDTLEQSDTQIRSMFTGGKWVAGLSAIVVISLVGTLWTVTTKAYDGKMSDLDAKIEQHDKEYEANIAQILKIIQNNEDLRVKTRQDISY